MEFVSPSRDTRAHLCVILERIKLKMSLVASTKENNQLHATIKQDLHKRLEHMHTFVTRVLGMCNGDVSWSKSERILLYTSVIVNIL